MNATRTMLVFSGDRKHPLIRFAFKVTRKFPALKKYVKVSLWDGYDFQMYIDNGKTWRRG